MPHFISGLSPVSLIELGLNEIRTVDLHVEAPWRETIEVYSDDAALAVEEEPVSIDATTRRFRVRAIRNGSFHLLARLPNGSSVLANLRVIAGRNDLIRYYHGTSSDIADLLLTADLEPMLLQRLMRGRVTAFDWTDYTDFGKGFYVHLNANRRMAWDWAKRRFPGEWAVVEFVLTRNELQPLLRTALHFTDKRDRPHNAPELTTVATRSIGVQVCPLPQILPCVGVEHRRTVTTSQTMSWLQFVEWNRHISSGALIARPNDRDWTAAYSRIRGPIWVPRDSGYDTGLQPFPDHIHQLDWGRAGMEVLNRPEPKARRYKYDSGNSNLHP